MADGGGPVVLRGLALEFGAAPAALRRLAADRLGVAAADIVEVRPLKVSLDARARPPRKVYTVQVWRAGDAVPAAEVPTPRPIPADMRTLAPGSAPIVVGSGPAGLWAALRLVQAGRPCVLVERGGALSRRHRAVTALRRRGELDPESNLCFGEGGAGTYSDGKLYTRISDPRVRRIYEDLVAFGAPADILIDAHPHIGTNRVVRVLERITAHLARAGCELRFDTRVVGLLRDRVGRVSGVRLADGGEIAGSAVVLAVGHAARDTYGWLHQLGVRLSPKAFAIGARLEHPQALIDRIQFGRYAGHPELGAAEYSLKAKVGPRGVYSFCMCPGGYVLPTATEPEHLNVNGMSASNRGSRWANSAIVVTLEPEDFWRERPGDLAAAHGPLAGVALQRHLERAAYRAGGGGYRAPAQRLTDFLDGRASADLPDRSSYRPGVTPSDLRAVLPERLAGPLARAVLRFDKKLAGFLTREAVLIGVETTTSSPVRVERDPTTLMAPGFEGLYPCGEGAGYAGGIVSSAVDGLRVAEAVLGRA